MSRFYEMSLTVKKFDKSKTDAITAAANKEWPFSELTHERNELAGCSQSNLCGGGGRGGICRAAGQGGFRGQR